MTFPILPALRKLKQEVDLLLTVIIDSREQDPLPFKHLRSTRGTLRTGDYSYVGGQDSLAIERKTIPDIVACCAGPNRERFEREMHRLRGFQLKRLAIVGSRSEIEQGNYRSNINPTSVLHSLAAWEIRYDLPILFFSTPEDAAFQVESWIFWHARELIENVNDLLRGVDDLVLDQNAGPPACCKCGRPVENPQAFGHDKRRRLFWCEDCADQSEPPVDESRDEPLPFD